MRRFLSLTLSALVLVVVHAGCSDDDDFGAFSGGVGAPCRSDRDCFSRCQEDFCTVDCDHDGHCPAGMACIDEHGGMCAFACGPPAACGAGYECQSTDRRGTDGSITVCLRR